MARKNKGNKRKRSSSKSPAQNKDANMDANVNNTGINTPIADQLSKTHGILYGQDTQQQFGPIHNPQYLQGTPFHTHPIAPPTTPANFMNVNQPMPSTHLSFNSPLTPAINVPLIYERFEKFMVDCTQKLQKLDVLDDVVSRLGRYGAKIYKSR